MAKVNITESERIVVKKQKFTITLDRKETVALYAVLNRVGGFPNGTRGLIENIKNELVASDSIIHEESRMLPVDPNKRAIYFDDGFYQE